MFDAMKHACVKETDEAAVKKMPIAAVKAPAKLERLWHAYYATHDRGANVMRYIGHRFKEEADLS